MATESFFSNASLAYLASAGAGKDGKTYSIKPTDGTGDFTFSRGSNLAATRVGADGLIEKGRENLITYSNDFTQWVQANVDVTINAVQNPFNTGTTQTIAEQVGTSTQYRVYTNSYTTSSGTMYSHSVYVKRLSGTRDFAIIDVSGGARVYFNMTTISVGSEEIGKGKIEDVGNGWYRLSVYGLATGNSSFFLAMANGATTGSETYTSDGSGSFALYAAQLEIGLAATDYIESGATTGKAGLLEDEPRFDYSGGATCPSLLLEPSRTNLVEYSEYFEGSGWTIQSGVTLTTNTTETLSPEGLYNAAKVVSTDATKGFYFGGLSITNAAVRTIYLKGSVGGETILFKDPSGFGTPSTKTLTTDWQRFEMATTNDGNTYQGLFIDDISVGTIYAFGAQLEEGSYPTSYITNHSGVSVTRGGDNCSTSNNSLLEQPSATYFFEVTPIEIASNNITDIREDGTTNNRILLQTNVSGSIRVSVRAQGSSILDQIVGNAAPQNTKVKIALKYTPSNISFFVDGVKKIDTDISVDFNPELNGLDLEGSATANDDTLKQHQFLFFSEALSDADCIALTT